MPPKPRGALAYLFLFCRAANMMVLIAQAGLVGTCLAMRPMHKDKISQGHMIGMIALSNLALVWTIVSWSGYTKQYIRYPVTWTLDFVFLVAFLAASVILGSTLITSVCTDLSAMGQASCHRHSVVWALLMISSGVFAISGICVACADCEGRAGDQSQRGDQQTACAGVVKPPELTPRRGVVKARQPRRQPREPGGLRAIQEAPESGNSWVSWTRSQRGSRLARANNRLTETMFSQPSIITGTNRERGWAGMSIDRPPSVDEISLLELGPPITRPNPSPYTLGRSKKESLGAPPLPLRLRSFHPSLLIDLESRPDEGSVIANSRRGTPAGDKPSKDGETPKWLKHIGNPSPAVNASGSVWPQREQTTMPNPLLLGGRSLTQNNHLGKQAGDPSAQNTIHGSTSLTTTPARPPRSPTSHFPPATPLLQQRQSVLERYSPSLYETERPSTTSSSSDNLPDRKNDKKLDKGKGVDRSSGYEAGFTQDQLRELQSLDKFLETTPISSPRSQAEVGASQQSSSNTPPLPSSSHDKSAQGTPSRASANDNNGAGEWDFIREALRERPLVRPPSLHPPVPKGEFDPYNVI